MRRIALTIILLAATLLPARAQERILAFVSDVTVERNGDLLVNETIRVQAQGREIRRGILRDFPTIYTRADGSRVVVGFEVKSVSRDGASEHFTTEALDNGVRVRIGSADRQLNPGVHEYLIVYRTTRQIGFFKDFDELYWNATGTGWTFPIDMAEARITLPQAVPFRQTAFYTGPQGAQGKDATIVEEKPGRIVFHTTRALPVHNGLTVTAGWQKGVIEEPDAAQRAGWWLADNLPLAVAVIGVLLMLAYYLYAWLRVGRDPPRGTIVPLFAPPDGVSAAAVRYIEIEGFDDRVFTAAIVDLGAHGHLRLVEQGKTMRLERRDGGQPIGRAEEVVKGKLFNIAPTLELIQSNYRPLGSAKDALKENLSIAFEGKLFKRNVGWSTLGALASVAAVLAIVLAMIATYGGDRLAMLLFGALFPIPGLAVGASVAVGISRGSLPKLIAWVFGLLFPLAFGGAGLVMLAINAYGWNDLLPGLAPFILTPVAILAFTWLKAPTIAGRRVMDQIEGFRQYLSIAEEARLEALNPPDKTPELFERFLPYAIALNVENSWARRFAGVLATAAAGAAAASTWYVGDRNFGTDPVSFADHLGGQLAQTVSSASSPPGSSDGGSGSGGGGSSGGGGGGGGGSGW
jgi:uncharacterized membrane protein YgcG